MKRIIIGTSRRCGSTFLYNIIKNTLVFSGFKIWAGFINNYNIRLDKEYDYIIIKVHKVEDYNRRDTDIIFTIERDIKDCIASARLRNNDEDYKEPINKLYNKYKEWEKYWKKESTFIYDYKSLSENSKRFIISVQENLREHIKGMPYAIGMEEGVFLTTTGTNFFLENLNFSKHQNNGSIGYYKDVLSKEDIYFLEEKEK